MKKKLFVMLLIATVTTSTSVSPSIRANAKNNTPIAACSLSGEPVKAMNTIVQELSNENCQENPMNYQEDLVEAACLEAQQRIEYLNNTVTDKKEWFIQYKYIIQEYNGLLDPPETLYDYYSEDELNLFFSVVQCEIGNENYSFDQKVNVANVILNRIESPLFPNTLSEVLVSSQFATIGYLKHHTVEISDDVILACEYAFMMPDTTDGALFFDSNSALRYIKLSNDGAHNFYTSRVAIKLKETEQAEITQE